jgi:hypothetical protein
LRDFEEHRRVNHPVYAGTIANQATFLGPTLGLGATMTFRGEGLRPALALHDAAHALVRAQREGVDEVIARTWLSDTFHEQEPELPRERPRHAPDLDRDGYRLISAEEAGREAVRFDRAPAVGDKVKVIVQFVAANEIGDAKPLVAGWWLELDEIARDHWSGTLDNVPRVPAPVVRGSRFWIRSDHVIEWAPAGG